MSLSTHVLDTVHGRGAGNMQVDVRRLQGGNTFSVMLDEHGRAELLAELEEGTYEILFHAGAYQNTEDRFYDIIPVRFHITDTAQNYHIPLILSAFGYSTYRGG